MVTQIFDRRTVAIPGPIGDVTPAALAARDAAIAARNDAVDARDEAEVFAAGTVALQDAAVTSLLENPTSGPRSLLDDTYVEKATLTMLAPRATGMDQLAALQAAVDQAATSGLTLSLNGAHVISGELLLPAGAKIDGRLGSITQAMNLRSVFRLENVSRVRISNVIAFGRTIDYTNASTVYRAAAVYCTGTTNDVVVEGCGFFGFAGAGVYMAGTCSNIHVRGRSVLTGAGPDYITSTSFNYGAGVVVMDGCENWSVQDCDISLGAQGIVTGHGCDEFHITGNTIHDIPGQHGIYFRAVSVGHVSGNTFVDIALQGMKVQITETGPGQAAHSLEITNNIFQNAGVHSILLSSTVSLAIEDVLISGNIIDGGRGGDGIAIDGATVTGVTIVDNTIRRTRYGIRVAGGGRIRIARNTITDIDLTAIYCNGTTWLVCDQNVVQAPAALASAADNFGIRVQSVGDGYVRGNIISDNTGKMRYGLYVPAGAMAVLDINDNVAIGAYDFGYRGLAEAARSFRGNRFEGVTGAMAGVPTNFPAIPNTTGATLAALESHMNTLKDMMRNQGFIRP